MENVKIGIIISTTREGRFGDKPAQWIYDIASARDDLDVEIVDLRDYPLPLFGEPEPSARDGSPQSEVAFRWKQKVAELDGYLFVTAEYNHSISGVLKNSLDYAYSEFNKKAAAFVAYGGVGGARAVEQLRLICIELQMVPTRTAVHISMDPYLAVTQQGKALSDFAYLNKGAEATLNELAWWAHTVKARRVADIQSRDEQRAKVGLST